jgi:inorganic pyrophosphatase
MKLDAVEVENHEFWKYLDQLVARSHLVIDRPKGSHHPFYEDVVYPLDYGYLAGTTSADGNGIDIWAGASDNAELSAVILTVDLHKRDAEIKILLGCTDQEIQTILKFTNTTCMRAMLVPKPKEF